MRSIPDDYLSLIYLDPPFNTGKKQSRTSLKTKQSASGDRVGFKGRTYETVKLATRSYNDSFEEYLQFLKPRLVECKRILATNGSLFFHIDYREAHYCKILLDETFGRASFMNEIIWAYDYGARSQKKWSSKHDSIFWYAKDPQNYIFNYDAIDRIPYMAPALVGAAKARRGKTPTDVWWHTIVSPNGYEKTGYPTQKPRGIIDRIVNVHSTPGNTVGDFFAGSGTVGEACLELGRSAILVDNNLAALEVMRKRFSNCAGTVIWDRAAPSPATNGRK